MSRFAARWALELQPSFREAAELLWALGLLWKTWGALKTVMNSSRDT